MSARGKRLAMVLGVWLVGFALAGWMHARRGALVSGFGGGDDEAAHMVSGVMIHDYLLGPTPASPVEYAKQYYTHYPKVGIGQWPPGYHVSQALWTLVFGVSRGSLVLFGAALASATAMLIFLALYRARGALTAGAGALAFLALPLVQYFSALSGTEVLLALLSFAAVLTFGRFLDTARWRPALAFGALASLAILTKGNALALALVPPLAIALRRQWALLRSPALWGMALLVALAAGPWTVWFLSVNQSTWGGSAASSGDYARRAALFYASRLGQVGGPPLLALAVWGAWRRLRDPEACGLWSAALAWIVGVLLFHIFVPSSIEERHLVLLLPCLCLFAADGARELAARVPRLAPRWQPALGALLLLGSFAALGWSFPRKDYRGFEEAVAYIKDHHEFDGLPVLIDSGPRGEGLAVSEFVLADRRPDRYVVRSTKFLCHSTWTGEDYVELYPGAEALSRALSEAPIGLVLYDRSMSCFLKDPPHRKTLHRVLEGEDWRLVRTFDVQRGARRYRGALELWGRRVHGGPRPFQLDFESLVDRSLPGVE